MQFFQLEVYNSDGSRLTESQIHSQLLRIRSQSWKTDKEPMGILTSEHRHTWGQAYNRLLTGGSRSRACLSGGLANANANAVTELFCLLPP